MEGVRALFRDFGGRSTEVTPAEKALRDIMVAARREIAAGNLLDVVESLNEAIRSRQVLAEGGRVRLGNPQLDVLRQMQSEYRRFRAGPEPDQIWLAINLGQSDFADVPPIDHLTRFASFRKPSSSVKSTLSPAVRYKLCSNGSDRAKFIVNILRCYQSYLQLHILRPHDWEVLKLYYNDYQEDRGTYPAGYLCDWYNNTEYDAVRQWLAGPIADALEENLPPKAPQGKARASKARRMKVVKVKARIIDYDSYSPEEAFDLAVTNLKPLAAGDQIIGDECLISLKVPEPDNRIYFQLGDKWRCVSRESLKEWWLKNGTDPFLNPIKPNDLVGKLRKPNDSAI